MNEYLVPAHCSEAELVEKRSRFIGQVCPVESEEEARNYISQIKKLHHDARHNCWCYRLKDGPERYSDDGEPQGTAGQPMLGVFQKEGVFNAVCVVTRYFGGVLLGAGGLVRAYTQCAKDALDAAGIAQMRLWTQVEVVCSYNLFERLKLEVESIGGLLGESEYAADVTIHALLPNGSHESFACRVRELTAGAVQPQITGTVYRAGPRQL